MRFSPAARPRPLATMLALLLLLAAAPAPALAQWPAFTEMGLRLYSHTDLDINGGNLGGLGLGVQTTAPLWDNDGARLDLRLELAVCGFWNYADGAEVSLAPGLRLYLPKPHHQGLAPFIEGGFGLAVNELHISELGTELNFLSYGGLGLRYGIAPTTFLDLGYRLRHISNGGLDENNHGLTSHLLGLEVAWLF